MPFLSLRNGIFIKNYYLFFLYIIWKCYFNVVDLDIDEFKNNKV